MRQAIPERRHASNRGREPVVLAHDYLNQRGGAERVVLELAAAFPGAPLLTSLYRPESTFPEFRGLNVRTSFLDRLPVDRGFRGLFPLFALAMRDLGPVEADVLIASSSGWAHGIRPASGTFHVVYCHNPARWLYGEAYMGTGPAGRAERMAAPALAALRRWDQAAARRPDLYIANSESTRRRIERVYGRSSVVLHPPVDTDRFTPTPRGDRLLVVTRLLPYKRVDLAVAAARDLGLPLDVVGDGPALADLRAAAGPDTVFHGRLPDDDVTHLMQDCAALLLCGEEDFGMAPVEVQAAGKPVVAFAAGGALETVVDGVTGAYFAEPHVAAVGRAIRLALDLPTSPEAIAERAARFSRAAFAEQLLAIVADAREARAR